MLTSKLAISGLLRFLGRTQSWAPGEAERGRSASARPELPLRRTAACMLPSSRQRPHSVPNHRHKVSRERYGSGQKASTAGPTPAKAKAGRETGWGARARSPSSEGAQSLDSGTSSALASPGRRRWPPSCKGAGPYPAPSTPRPDWRIPVVMSYDWLSANHPFPCTWGSARVPLADGVGAGLWTHLH